MTLHQISTLFAENVYWIFSGVGVPLVTGIIALIRSRQSPSSGAEPPASPNDAAPSVTEQQKPTESEAIRRRFNSVLALMNEGRERPRFTIAGLAQIMKLHKLSELEGVFLGSLEPTFEFIQNFCEHFGVSYKWLTEGSGAPFAIDDGGYCEAEDYYPLICDTAPEEIFFVRADTHASEAKLVLKEAPHRYRVLNATWHVSSVVGDGGARALVSLYNLIRQMRKDGRHLSAYGRTISGKDFLRLASGEVFPGAICDTFHGPDYWWDDLVDVQHKYPIAENYQEWHGTNFVDAQRIIRSRLGESGS